MKYTIEGYSQEVAMALDLNIEDLVFLRWFIDFKEGGDMKAKYNADKNNMGYWVNYSKVVKDLPIMFATHPKSKDGWDTLSNEEQTILLKKWKKACREKVRRILSGNLSKVLTRTKEQKRNEEGELITEIYITVNPTVYKLLVSKNHLQLDVKNIVDETKPQKCGTVKTITKPQKCGAVTKPQKCGINTSITIPDSSITTGADKSACSVNKENSKNKNIELVEKTIQLDNFTDNMKRKVSRWNTDRLIKAMEIYNATDRERNVFKLLELIYKEDRNFIGNNVRFKQVKTRFHNIEQTFTKYTPDELEKILLESQKNKFN